MSVTAPALQPCHALIGGRRVTSRGQTQVQVNPATGRPVAAIPASTPEEIDAAVRAAREAFPGWGKTPVLQRARVLFQYRQLLVQHADELIAMVTEENGKTLDEAKASYGRALEAVEFACGAPTLMMGETLEGVGVAADAYTVRRPLGVCVGITPFNFPLMVPLWMYPIAIACGNTFILKPSDRVPRTAVRAAELMYEAGLPAGVLNVVHGAKQAVDELLHHPEVDAVSFVGSSAVAKYIYSTAAANGKRVQALGGAKNHSVVMPDCEMKSTVEALIASTFGCAGERCVATSVVVAVGEVGDKLVDELRKAASALVVGDGSEKGTTMGPLITSEHRDRVLKYIETGEQEGAKLARDGRGCQAGEGYYVGPTIFDHVTPDMKIAQDEIFGPVLSVIRAKNLSEALAVVNRCEYGNAASIYTRSGSAAREFTEGVEAGMLGVNIGVPAPVAIFPFSGWKGSFYGDLHALGKDAVKFYTESRVVTARWPE